MPSKITQVMTVVDIGEVEFQGELGVGPCFEESEFDDCWGVWQRGGVSGKDKVSFESFEEYFEKLQGKKVRITIKNLEAEDNKELIDKFPNKEKFMEQLKKRVEERKKMVDKEV